MHLCSPAPRALALHAQLSHLAPVARVVNLSSLYVSNESNHTHDPSADMAALVAASPIAIAFIDKELRYRQVNDAFATIHRRSADDYIGRSVRDISPAWAPVVEPVLLDVLTTGEAAAAIELENDEHDAAVKRCFLATHFPVREGDAMIGIGQVVVDITHRRVSEEQAQLLARSREQVLAIVAHDLRSPLSAIRLTTKLLGRAPTNQRTEHGLDVIQRSTVRMQRLVDDLLDSAAIRSGRLSLQCANEPAAEILNEAVVTNEVLALEQGIQFERSGPPVTIDINCDRRRILQVFTNLVCNAIKACRQGDLITLSAQLEPPNVLFSVRDTGPGMTAEQLAAHFDPEQAIARRSGLGLYICKGIVEAHGGRIWAESELGHGATVSFALPVRSRDAE